MTELEKIAYAKTFIDKLANGINPLDDTPIPDGDIVNHVRLSRCFFYVSDILRQVIENGGTETQRQSRPGKNEFALTPEMRAELRVANIPMTLKEIVQYLNALVDTETTKKISAATINQWLVDIGLLENVSQYNGKQKKLPTKQGNEMGIVPETRTGQFGTYTVVLFTPQAQQFIYDNIDAIIASKHAPRDEV